MAVREMTVEQAQERQAKQSGAPRQPNAINRLLSIIAWVASAATTWLALSAFMVNPPWWLPITTAIIVQGTLTAVERPIWKGRMSAFNLSILLFDVLLNAGGIFPYASRFGGTPTGQMLVTVMGGSSQIAPITAMIISIVLGMLVAAAPEALWNQKD